MLSIIRRLRQRRRAARETDDELSFHLAMEERANRERGMAPAEARRAARRDLGGVAQTREAIREVRAFWIEDVWHDVRHACRLFTRDYGFTLAVVLTLALGIGATTANFSLLRAVLLDPLPYPDASRLVFVWEDGSWAGQPSTIDVAPGNYADWDAQNVAFEAMAALDVGSVSLTGVGDPVRLSGRRVTHDIFQVLGVPPALGRPFTAQEEQPGQDDVAILSDASWRSRFGAAPDVLGRRVLLDGVPHAIVGVMPPGFDFPERGTEIWRPLALTPEQHRSRSAHYLTVVARLRPGVSIDRARQAMDALARRIAGSLPAGAAAGTRFGASVQPLRERLVGETRTAVLLLFVMAASVFLLALANLANLVLARAIDRHREVAVRVALGAGRGRVFRQLATEHLLLSATAAGVGIFVAIEGLEYLAALVPANLTSARLVVDPVLLLFASSLAIFTTLVLGAVPARLAWRQQIREAVAVGSSRTGDSAATIRLRSGLIVTQTAFVVVLLIAAALLAQTFLRLRAVDPGFRGEGVLTLRTDLPVPRYADHARRLGFYTQVLERVRALPGVTRAGFTSFLPLAFGGAANVVMAENQPEPPVQAANFRLVTSGYLESMGATLARGRYLTDADEGGEPVAVINEAMARYFWPGGDALDRRFRIRSCQTCWIRVVGIVNDMNQGSLGGDVRPEYFVPATHGRAAIPFMQPKDLAIRTAGDPRTLIDLVRRAILEVDPEQPVSDVRVMADYREQELAPHRFQAQLISGFAALALALASIGVYGVLSYTVARRRREVGLRMALGAGRREVVRWVMAQGLRPILAGLAVGLVFAYFLAQLVAGLLYGVQPRDPLSYGIAAGVLLAVALAACWLPALRASRVDPFVVLRSE